MFVFTAMMIEIWHIPLSDKDFTLQGSKQNVGKFNILYLIDS